MNLFEFMKRMRKVVRVGIQEIGYGYLPLAWASLTAYWLGLGLSELGLTLTRLPATVFGAAANTLEWHWLPAVAASPSVIQTVQSVLVLGAIPPGDALSHVVGSIFLLILGILASRDLIGRLFSFIVDVNGIVERVLLLATTEAVWNKSSSIAYESYKEVLGIKTLNVSIVVKESKSMKKAPGLRVRPASLCISQKNSLEKKFPTILRSEDVLGVLLYESLAANAQQKDVQVV